MSPGDFLQPGDAVVELVATDPIKLDFQIPESQSACVAVGQQVAIRVDAWPGRTFTGELKAIAPSINEGGRSLMLRARLDNLDQALRPGMFARFRLSLGGDARALTIPEQAIMPEGNQRFVYRVVDGKAIRTEVTTGRREATRVEVVEGLAEGDQIVISGQIKLQDGSAVQPLPATEN